MIQCAVIGYGYWGPNIVRSIAKLSGVRLAAVCDMDPRRLQEAKSLYPGAKAVNDLDRILESASIDALIVATPARTHFAVASQALASGKHVLVEKPLTTTISQAVALASFSKKYKKTLMVGHTFEYNPAVILMKKITHQEDFGNIYYVYSSRLNLGQVRGDVNALWNLAPHDISILNFLFDQLPEEVLVTGTSFLQKSIEDIVFITAKYSKNTLAHIHLSWIDPSKERKMTVVGAKKMLIFDDLDNETPIKIYDKRVDTSEIARGSSIEYTIKLHSGDIYSPQVDHAEPLLEELKHFFDCIRKNQKPKTDVQNGMRVVRVLEACQKSLERKSQWIKV